MVVLSVMAAASVFAAEHTGVVRLHGKGVPGVSVVASSGDRKLATSTDESGIYRLDLSDGEWQLLDRAVLFREAKQDADTERIRKFPGLGPEVSSGSSSAGSNAWKSAAGISNGQS